MPRKGENIRKRKDGRWEGRFKKGVKENGSIDYGSVYGRSYKEVKEKLMLARTSYKNDRSVSTGEKRFSEVLDLWEASNRIRLKGSSGQKYNYLIKTHIMPELGGLKLSQITATTVNSFLNSKLHSGRLNGKGGLSPSYVSSIMVIVNAAINFAVAEQMCPPLRTPIYKPKAEKKDLEILKPEEQALIEQYAIANLNSTNIGILISLYTGLRIGEVCALTWNDIDFVENTLRVRHTVARIQSDITADKSASRLIIDEPKTRASKRDIPIPSVLLSAMQKYREASCSGFVISDKADFISPRTYEYRYHRVLERCGVKSTNYHTLRHTFASRCIAAGVDIKSLSEVLGHGNSAITLNTYVHSSIDQKRSQLEKLVSYAAY